MTEEQIIRAVDAAMVEMANIHPPLRRGECERLIRAALAAWWQPLESAPRDGTYILVTDGKVTDVTRYSYGTFGGIKHPAYWMPLPAPPSI